MTSLTVVIPIFRDAYLAAPYCEALEVATATWVEQRSDPLFVDVIFVEDGGLDGDVEILKECQARWDNVSVIQLSRNFGQHFAIACGFQHATGQYVARTNVDQQDSPADMLKLLAALIDERADQAIGLYEYRHHGRREIFASKLYFNLFSALTGSDAETNSSPTRVMNRRWIDVYNGFGGVHRFPQEIEPWMGFRRIWVPISHAPRARGESSYTFKSRLRLGIQGLKSSGGRALVSVVGVGIILIVAALIFAIATVIRRVLWADVVPGFAALLTVNVLLFGVLFVVLGLVGLIASAIYEEVRGRPAYLVQGEWPASATQVRRVANGETHESEAR